MIEVKDYLHHLELLFKRNVGVVLVESVLLKEADTDNSRNLDDKLLIVGKNIGAD